MNKIKIKHRLYSLLELEWEWTNDRDPLFEVFAPDGMMFSPSDVTSFVCLDRKDAIERVQASELIPFVDAGV